MTTQEHPPPEEPPDNQMDRMTQAVSVSPPLVPSTPVLTQLAQEWNSHGGRFGDYDWPEAGAPTHQSWSSYHCYSMPNLPAARANPKTHIAPFLKETNQPLGAKLIIGPSERCVAFS